MLTYSRSFSHRWRRERLRSADLDQINPLYHPDRPPCRRLGHPYQPHPRFGISPSFPLTFFQVSTRSIPHQHHRPPTVPAGIPRRCVALRSAHGLRVILRACRNDPGRLGHTRLVCDAEDHRQPQGKEEAHRRKCRDERRELLQQAEQGWPAPVYCAAYYAHRQRSERRRDRQAAHFRLIREEGQHKRRAYPAHGAQPFGAVPQ